MNLWTDVRSARRTAYGWYRRSPLWHSLNPRRIHVYGVGTPKSGTHSLHGVFRQHYLARHEPEARNTIELILDVVDGAITEAEQTDLIRRRDRRLRLELDSSQLNSFLIDTLVQEFPQAKFLLTIRDCYSWLDSYINHQLRGPPTEPWRRLRDFRFASKRYTHARGETVLAEHRLYTLDGYLSYWARHNSKVLEAAPSDRLLVVRTCDIRRDMETIAEFLNIPVNTLDTNRSHSFPARKKFGLLTKVDRELLAEKVHLHCERLMVRFFPEIRDAADTVNLFPLSSSKSSGDVR